MNPSAGAALELLGRAISSGGGCATFLLADAGEVGDWAGDTNATSSDPYDSEGSDWHRVLLESLDDDVVEVDLGAGRRGLGVTMGETGRHTVFRTPTGLLLATRQGGPAGDADYPTAAGSTERLLSSDAFWDFVSAPLTKPFLGGTLRTPSGWLMIMSAMVPASGLHRDDSPVELPALLDAEQSGTDAVELSDGYGGRALLVRVGPTALSVWFEHQHSDPALGTVDRCELRFER
ncbi:hypothetical protein AB0B66_20625 [Catellatospora sp. NPDC049111]|uniref:hypothetical protein n=1 Tax=Catellatospora sp. NPDC049111 TaxID=3155271 RepID=UPI0033C87E14